MGLVGGGGGAAKQRAPRPTCVYTCKCITHMYI